MKTEACRNEAGFSLVELLTAMVVTLVVTGAIYGLLVGGKSVFRREPELTDRQQNIRVAMALIERDVALAGQDLGDFQQVFTNNLNNRPTADATPPGGDNPPSVLPNNGGPRSDYLEIRGNDGNCPALQVCEEPNANNAEIKTFSLIPACFNVPGMVVIRNRETGESVIRWACVPGTGTAGSCGGGGGGDNGHTTFPPGSAPNGCSAPGVPCNQPGGIGIDCSGGNKCDVSAIQMVRYEVRTDAQGIPNLWRSPNGGLSAGATGACATPGGGANDWQLVARGVEDLQVQYRTAAGWAPVPGDYPPLPAPPAPPAAANWDAVVREVRVTLSARALAPNLEGARMGAGGAGVLAVRGAVTRTISPRSALLTLGKAPDTYPNKWR